MNVIFEGLNCTGKSSLIRDLENMIPLDVPYVHNVRTSSLNDFHPLIDISMGINYGYMKALIDVVGNSKKDMWFDRFHITEYAYGIVNRGYYESDARRILLDIDDALKFHELRQTRIVYMSDFIDDVYRRMVTNRKYDWKFSKVLQIDTLMRQALGLSTLPVLIVNYAEFANKDEVKEEVINFVKGGGL